MDKQRAEQEIEDELDEKERETARAFDIMLQTIEEDAERTILEMESNGATRLAVFEELQIFSARKKEIMDHKDYILAAHRSDALEKLKRIF